MHEERSWDEELIFQRTERVMELPEDALIYLLRKQPKLQLLIDAFVLSLEY